MDDEEKPKPFDERFTPSLAQFLSVAQYLESSVLLTAMRTGFLGIRVVPESRGVDIGKFGDLPEGAIRKLAHALNVDGPAPVPEVNTKNAKKNIFKLQGVTTRLIQRHRKRWADSV